MEETITQRRRIPRLTNAQAGEINGMVPPQAVELEKSVLGALMLDKESLYGSLDKLHEGLFYKDEHQAIFGAIRRLANCSQEVDMLTVVEELRREGRLEQAGGAFYVSQLTLNVVSAAHIDFHIQILAEKYIQREVIRTSTESIREAYDETCDPVGLLDKAQQRLMEVSEQSFRKDASLLDAVMMETREALFTEGEDHYRIQSGFMELDRLTTGFKPGTLIILAARPGMGKTACGLNMARNIAVDFGKPVAFFSLEMTGVELAMRLLSAEAMIEGRKLQHAAKLTGAEKQRIAEAMNGLQRAPIYIDDTAGINIFEMRAKCRRLKQKYNIQMVFIDYLQLMGPVNDGNRTRNRDQELGIVSRQLKEMSKELNIPVLAMAQFNRKVDDRVMGVPKLSDLRESGSIEQDADIVIAINRLEKCGIDRDEHGNPTAGQAHFHILKHRAGDTKTIEVRFDARCVRFYDVPKFVIKDSKINSDIAPNANFDGPSVRNPDNPAGELPTDSDGNPIFENGGLPPVEDTTPPAIVKPQETNQMPIDDELPWENGN